MDAILVGSVLTFFTSAFTLMGGFGFRMYLELQRNERRCTARLNIHQRRQSEYEHQIQMIGKPIDRSLLDHLSLLEERILIGDRDAIAEAGA